MKRVIWVLALATGVTGCTMGSSAPPASKPDLSQSQPTSPTRTFDGWTIKVRVLQPRIGPLALATKPVRAAPNNDAKPWVRHELIFRNLGVRPLHFDDTRTSKFLRHRGNRALLAADEGCGYGIASPGAAVEQGACQNYLDAFVVKPHASVTREITLSKGLSGMAELAEGSYVFRKDIRFKVGSHGREYVKTIAIRYLVRSEDAF